MVKVQLVKMISCSDGGVTMARNIEMPHPPFPGLLIYSRALAENEMCGSVAYDMERGLYLVKCDTTAYGSKSEDVVKKYSADGWMKSCYWPDGA